MSGSSNLNGRQFAAVTRKWTTQDSTPYVRDAGGIDPEEARTRVFREKTRKVSGEGRPKGSAPLPSKWGWVDFGNRSN